MLILVETLCVIVPKEIFPLAWVKLNTKSILVLLLKLIKRVGNGLNILVIPNNVNSEVKYSPNTKLLNYKLLLNQFYP
ncbi:hypothetical protein [Spiroplasma sp. Moj]|uniref:hypothetical protein n=1 Tax=Spiroplasma sp. Moj TaxID=1922342 RepID=UPI0039F09791|nr:hypothetical protein [Spiroplasma sp. Moj]